jgi:hypothetical protein
MASYSNLDCASLHAGEIVVAETVDNDQVRRLSCSVPTEFPGGYCWCACADGLLRRFVKRVRESPARRMMRQGMRMMASSRGGRSGTLLTNLRDRLAGCA